MKTFIYSRQINIEDGTESGPLREAVGNRRDTVTGIFFDDPAITGKGRHKGWNAMIAALDDADMVVVGCANDLPGRTVTDLYRTLSILNEHGVGLCLRHEGITTQDGAAAILAMTLVFRAVKRSQAIRRGIARARKAGKSIGRPATPERVRRRGLADLAISGVRPTARKHNVSPATVINIRRSMMAAEADREVM